MTTAQLSSENIGKKIFIALYLTILSIVGFYLSNNFIFFTANQTIETTIKFSAEEESMIALEFIELNCKGSINHEFPEDFWSKTIKEIRNLAQGKGEMAKKAKKAFKLLSDNRFRKP